MKQEETMLEIISNSQLTEVPTYEMQCTDASRDPVRRVFVLSVVLFGFILVGFIFCTLWFGVGGENTY